MVWQQATAALPDTLATAALPTGDGGFVVSGVTTNWGRDVLLFKTDSRGRIAAFTDLAPKVQPPVKKPKPAKKPEKTEPAPKTGVMPDDTRPPVVSDDKAPVRPDHVSEKAPEKAPVKNEAAKSSATGTATTNSVKAEDRPAANSTGGADTPEYDLFDLLGGIFNSSPADGNGEGAPNKADGGNKQPSAAQGNTVSPRR
jgi:outer membrane biosynthesis protein TonB